MEARRWKAGRLGVARIPSLPIRQFITSYVRCKPPCNRSAAAIPVPVGQPSGVEASAGAGLEDHIRWNGDYSLTRMPSGSGTRDLAGTLLTGSDPAQLMSATRTVAGSCKGLCTTRSGHWINKAKLGITPTP
jgi:hypothetical protein